MEIALEPLEVFVAIILKVTSRDKLTTTFRVGIASNTRSSMCLHENFVLFFEKDTKFLQVITPRKTKVTIILKGKGLTFSIHYEFMYLVGGSIREQLGELGS